MTTVCESVTASVSPVVLCAHGPVINHFVCVNAVHRAYLGFRPSEDILDILFLKRADYRVIFGLWG